jgi:hypothetical protein
VDSREKNAPIASPAPRSGLRFMALFLLVMALLSIYANVQKTRRARVETVTITPAESPMLTPTASPSPSTN